MHTPAPCPSHAPPTSWCRRPERVGGGAGASIPRMPVESTVSHALGQQLTVQVEGGQTEKSGVPPRGVTSER